jgi:hypothetical protein
VRIEQGVQDLGGYKTTDLMHHISCHKRPAPSTCAGICLEAPLPILIRRSAMAIGEKSANPPTQTGSTHRISSGGT